MPRMVKTKSAKKKAAVKPKAKVKKPLKAVKAKKPLKAAKKPAKTSKAAPKVVVKKGSLNVGARVPAFAMPATIAGEVSAVSLQGKPFVLYFYPKDDTSGCTAQACGFRDAVPDFGKLGLTVVGVSKDSLKSHEKFAGKYGLSFPLASDENTKVCEAFGTWVEKSMYGRRYMGIERSTFLIDGKGIVRTIWRKVSVPGHIDDVKKAVAEL